MDAFNATRMRASALQLNFQEMWQEIHLASPSSSASSLPSVASGPVGKAQQDKEKEEEKAVGTLCYAGNLPTDVILSIVPLLQVRDLLRCRQLCSTTYRVLSAPLYDSIVWDVCLSHNFSALHQRRSPPPRRSEHLDKGSSDGAHKPSDTSTQVSRAAQCNVNLYSHRPAFLRVLEAALNETEAELRHWSNSNYLIDGMANMSPGDVVGLLSNVGRFNDTALAIAVSIARYQAMTTVIIRDKSVAMRYKRGLRFDGPVSFCSLSSGQNPGWMRQSEHLPRIQAPGFLGYVVELIELRPQEEHLRFTALLWCYANLCVFTTEREAIAANEARLREDSTADHLRYVSLDLLDQPGFDLAHWCRTGEFTLPNGTVVVSKCHVSFGEFRTHVYCPWGSSSANLSNRYAGIDSGGVVVVPRRHGGAGNLRGRVVSSSGSGERPTGGGWRGGGTWMDAWNSLSGASEEVKRSSGAAMRVTEGLMRKRDSLKATLEKLVSFQ
jgi:hypothetical protein